MMFFWKIFDGIISYITPLVITGEGFSKTTMGIIYASSSVFGAIFDVVLSKYLKNSNYRRIFLALMIVSFIHPLLLWQSKTIWMFLIAMSTWGLYYDLANFGIMDFISRKMSPDEHASSFGVTDVFRALGNLIAPILAGILIVGSVITWNLFAISWVFVAFALIVLLVDILFSRKSHYEYIKLQKERSTSLFGEIFLLLSTLKFVFPVFILTTLIFIYDAFFWTIGPLFSEQFSNIHPLNGLFMAGYSLPTLLIGWFVGDISKKFGQTKTAFYAFLFGSLALIPFAFIGKFPVLLFCIVLISSAFVAISLSTVKAIYSDLILMKPHKESEIGAWSDLGTNFGFIIGPLAAGILSDKLGNIESFSVFGVIGAMVSVILIRSKFK